MSDSRNHASNRHRRSSRRSQHYLGNYQVQKIDALKEKLNSEACVNLSIEDKKQYLEALLAISSKVNTQGFSSEVGKMIELLETSINNDIEQTTSHADSVDKFGTFKRAMSEVKLAEIRHNNPKQETLPEQTTRPKSVTKHPGFFRSCCAAGIDDSDDEPDNQVSIKKSNS